MLELLGKGGADIRAGNAAQLLEYLPRICDAPGSENVPSCYWREVKWSSTECPYHF